MSDRYKELLERSSKTSVELERLSGVSQSVSEKIERCGEEISEAGENKKISEDTKGFYQKAIDIIYERSLGEAKRLVNRVLSYVFFDRSFEFDLRVEEKHGKSLEMKLFEDGEEKDLNDGVGQGLRAVISFALQTYYILSRGAVPIIFVDEAYTVISVSYRGRFFDFVKALAEEKGLALVMISHDSNLISYADVTYEASQGRILKR